jgi:hypothetical protein
VVRGVSARDTKRAKRSSSKEGKLAPLTPAAIWLFIVARLKTFLERDSAGQC